MDIYSIKAESLMKRFNRQRLFKDLDIELKTGSSLSLTGPNGSGKSTLMRILAGLQTPTKGKVRYFSGKNEIEDSRINRHIGFISPLLNPYDELTALENIGFAAHKGKIVSEVKPLLEKFKLYEHREKMLRYYSSGMKQRLKFIIAVINDPSILFLDEPGTNLDREGKDLIYSFIDEKKKEKIIVIAANEKEEVSLCKEELRLA